MKHLIGLAAALALFGSVAQGQSSLPQAGDPYFGLARSTLDARLREIANTGRARNVILFVGDGMGIATLTAARIYEGQRRGADGESNRLALERLPHTALSKTYTHDFQVADSAPTATAMVTGIKTRNAIIGLNSDAEVGDCAGSKGKEVATIAAMAERAGLATGVVSTARVTHATPAALYAHMPNRDWEGDGDMPAEIIAAGCKDIAQQLVAWPQGDGLDVILGGGRARFLPSTAKDPEEPGRWGAQRRARPHR